MKKVDLSHMRTTKFSKGKTAQMKTRAPLKSPGKDDATALGISKPSKPFKGSRPSGPGEVYGGSGDQSGRGLLS